MGKKAKSDHTAKQRAAEHPSLDDDANWLSLTEALLQRIKQTSSIGLAILLMERELTQDHLPCMAQSATTGEKRWVESATWPELRLYSQTPGPPAGGASRIASPTLPTWAM